MGWHGLATCGTDKGTSVGEGVGIMEVVMGKEGMDKEGDDDISEAGQVGALKVASGTCVVGTISAAEWTQWRKNGVLEKLWINDKGETVFVSKQT